MKIIGKFLFWNAALLCLALFFYVFDPTPASALTDESTLVTLQTDSGILTLSMAEYLPRAVAAEMPVSFGAEALRAQAVAIRTYVLAGGRHGNADVCTDSTCCLAWMDEQALRDFWGADYKKNFAAVCAAVHETDGQYLSYNGAAIEAVFHASSALRTEDSAAVWSPLPYLVSVDSPETAESLPELVTGVCVTAAEFAEILSLSDRDDPAGWIESVVPESSGRVKSILIQGQSYSGSYIRAAFGLQSTAFTLQWDGEKFVFTVYGSGHGVGMSQYGAKLLAAEGWDYRSILAHYYPGTELISPRTGT